MRWLGLILSTITWVLVAGSLLVLAGGLLERPLLLAAVPTGSMEPVLRPGDLIMVLPTWAAGPPGIGAIVVFRTDQDAAWVVHRIVGGDARDGFVTKGDGNQAADPHRVLPRDMAGVVPIWRERAVRIPRLGLLSTDSGPLSSPVAASVALVMGVYLLVLDMKVEVPGRPGRRRRPDAAFSMYLGLAATAFLTTLMPSWALSGTQTIHYEVVAQRPTNVSRAGQYLAGESYREEVPLSNPSPLPILIVVKGTDPSVHFEPPWVLISGGGRRVIRVAVDSHELGEHQAAVHTAGVVPFLPPALLAHLARLGMAVAVVVNAMAPAALLCGIALLDARCRSALRQHCTRIARRFA